MESRETVKFALEVSTNVAQVLLRFVGLNLPRLKFGRDERGRFKVSIDDGRSSEPIDDRLAKIELARTSLHDALGAIDELKSRAEENKRDLELLTAQIQRAELDKASLSDELKTLKGISALDSEAVRKVLRLPTRVSIWTERVIAFLLGVAASTLASVLYEYVVKKFI